MPDGGVYLWTVRGTASGPTLAGRLDAAGFDVTAVHGAGVTVLGTLEVGSELARVPGTRVVTHVAAAPSATPAAAPANQNSILPRKLHGNTYPTYYGGYRTDAGYRQFEADLQAAYPKLVKVVTYGQSATQHLPLNAVCVTEDAQSGCGLDPQTSKPRLLLETQIHAREIATSEMAWRFLTKLIDGDKSDPQITALLRGSEIWVVPQVNPDGIELVQNGITQNGTGSNSQAWQRKNDDEAQTPSGGCPPPWSSSQPGVDLNRNWSVHYGGASTSKNPCSEVFIGSGPMSEPETTALATLTTDLFRDQRGSGSAAAPKSTVGEMLTFHTDGGVNLIPWDYDSNAKAPNDAGLRALGFRQSYFTSLPTGQSGQVLWAYSKLGIPAATWELADQAGCSGFFPAYTCMDSFANRYLPGLVYTAGAARKPYALSLGPTVLDASVTGSGNVTVQATANDAALGAQGFGKPTAQPVTAARIFVGTAPWDGGTSMPMTITGSGTSVTVSASVPRTGKQRLAYIQAQDSASNWGPTQAVWIPAS
jgi:hypothetical protein